MKLQILNTDGLVKSNGEISSITLVKYINKYRGMDRRPKPDMTHLELIELIEEELYDDIQSGALKDAIDRADKNKVVKSYMLNKAQVEAVIRTESRYVWSSISEILKEEKSYSEQRVVKLMTLINSNSDIEIAKTYKELSEMDTAHARIADGDILNTSDIIKCIVGTAKHRGMYAIKSSKMNATTLYRYLHYYGLLDHIDGKFYANENFDAAFTANGLGKGKPNPSGLRVPLFTEKALKFFQKDEFILGMNAFLDNYQEKIAVSRDGFKTFIAMIESK